MTTPLVPPADAAAEEPLARPIARSGREVLERVMLHLSSLPARVDRGPVLAALGGALSALAQLDRSGYDDLDHLDVLRAAVAAAGRAHGEMLKAEGANGSAGLSVSLSGVFDALSRVVEPTIDRVVARQDRLLRRRVEAPPPKPDLAVFATSDGVPRLFAFERDPLPPPVRTSPLASAVRDEEVREIEAEGDEGEDLAARAAEGPGGILEEPDEEGSLDRQVWDGWEQGVDSAQEAEAHALRRLARDAAEDVGSLGLLRAPTGPETAWEPGPSSFEERLLANLDALVALGEPFVSSGGEQRIDVLSVLLEWAGDAMVPDPARAFGRAFVLGCVAGEDTARAAVMSLRQSHPITYEAQRDALSLAPHEGLTPLIERMITEEPAPLVRVGLSVLERRRQASFEVVSPLLSHPDASVRAAAARCLAVTSPAQAAMSLLLSHAEGEEDDAALAATAESLLVMGSRRGLDLVRRMLAEEVSFPGSLPKGVRASCLRLLSVSGGPPDADLLLGSLGHDETAALSLGWFGDATLVPAMLGALSESAGLAARAGFAIALVRALHRITGLGRTATSDPRDSIHVVDPPLDPGFWARVWQEKREAFAARRRYRFGSVYSPLLTIREAETPEVSTGVRRELLLELSIASRGASRAHVEDWVARQKAALGEMKEHFGRGGEGAYPEGQWPRGVLFE